MRTVILTIGDELISGSTVNTNATWMERKLIEQGFPVSECLTVGDSQEEIVQALAYLWESNDLILTTGGLGPTSDDRTANAVAEFFHTDMVFHEPTFEKLRKRLSSRNIPVTEQHRQQAKVPENAEIILNEVGTAPVLHFIDGQKQLYCLPGVPFEMKHLVEEQIIPKLSREYAIEYATRLVRTTGLPESTVSDKIADIIKPLPVEAVAFLPHIYGVDVRFTMEKSAAEKAQLEEFVSAVSDRLGETVYSNGNQTLSEVVGNSLRETGMRVATAESCTGGLLADEITNVSGSSDYFLEGVVTYSNLSKTRQLGVPGSEIEKYGAVSEAVAKSMAQGMREISGADIALSTTGIAGPTGGTLEKPVGLVYIGYADKDREEAHRYQFGEDRRLNKERTVYAALNLLRLLLKKND